MSGSGYITDYKRPCHGSSLTAVRVEEARRVRRSWRILEYAGGSSIVSGSTWSDKSSLGPASSCSIILTGRDEALLRVVAVVVVVVVDGVVGVCGCSISAATILVGIERGRSYVEAASDVALVVESGTVPL